MNPQVAQNKYKSLSKIQNKPIMQNTFNEDTYDEEGSHTYTRTEGVGNQTPPHFEGTNLPPGTFPPEMLNHKKPRLRVNTSSKSLINKQGT